MRSKHRSVRGECGKCIEPGTRGSAAPLPSRYVPTSRDPLGDVAAVTSLSDEEKRTVLGTTAAGLLEIR
jgi:hypothetical protein